MSTKENSFFKIPIPKSLIKKNNASSSAGSNMVPSHIQAGSVFTSAQWAPNFNSDRIQMQPTEPPPPYQARPTNASLLSNDSLLRLHSVYNPPSMSSTLQNSTIYNHFNNHAIPSSTPLHRHENRSLLRPQQHGANENYSFMSIPGSVYNSMNNTENCEDVLLTACNLYLDRTDIPPDLKNTVRTIVKGMSCYMGEAQRIGASSVKSHFSKFGRSIKSGFSKISDHSTDTLSQIFKNPNLLSLSRTQNPTQSVLSSVPQRSANGENGKEVVLNVTVNVVNKTIENSLKRSRGDGTDDEAIPTPATVKRRLDQPLDIGDIMEWDSASDQLKRKNVALRRGRIEKRKAVAEAKNKKKKACTTPDETMSHTPVASKVKAKSSRKAETSQSDLNSSVKAPVVSCTRSGRNVKRPSFYTGAHPKKKVTSTTDASKLKLVIEKPQKKQPSSEPANIKKNSKKNKDAIQKETIKVKSPIVVLTRSGRQAKLKNADLRETSFSNNSTPSKKIVEKAPPKRKGKEKQTPAEKKTVAKPLAFDNDTSFGADDFFVPEVTQSTRRQICKVKGLNKLGAQTPPLAYFTANLNPQLVCGATPSQTPDWQLSQRTQSEVKQLQKRKNIKKSKALLLPIKKTAVIKKAKKLTKEEAEMLKLVRDERITIPVGMQVLNRSDLNESEELDESS